MRKMYRADNCWCAMMKQISSFCLLFLLFSLPGNSSAEGQDCYDCSVGGQEKEEEAFIPYNGGILTKRSVGHVVCDSLYDGEAPVGGGCQYYELVLFQAIGEWNSDGGRTCHPREPVDEETGKKIREWWEIAMPHIHCGAKNGLEWGSPLRAFAYRNSRAIFMNLVHKYHLDPEMLLYPDPKDGLNIMEWLQHRSREEETLYSERKKEDFKKMYDYIKLGFFGEREF